MNIEQLAKESYENAKITFSLVDSENTFITGFGRGFLQGMDYAQSLIKLQGEEAPTLNRQDKIIVSEENEKTLHY